MDSVGDRLRGTVETLMDANLSDRELERAVDVLRRGGLVAFPTETVYGLGADASNPAAVKKIFQAKGRPADHPLIVHLPGSDALAEWAVEVTDVALGLASRFWPGPLTLILRRQPNVPLAVTGGLETVALRVPDHPVALALLRQFGGGIAAPSANRFGAVSPTRAERVRAELGPAVDFVLDGRTGRVAVGSTIVDLASGAPMLLRPGGITREQLEDTVGEISEPNAEQRVRAPGQHASHYAPKARVYLVEASSIPDEARRLIDRGLRVGVLLPPGEPEDNVAGSYSLRVPESMEEYGARLYQMLRRFDEERCDAILASLPDERDIGLAIADRLRRAARIGC